MAGRTPLNDRLQEIGRQISPDNAKRTGALLAEEFTGGLLDRVRVTRDVPYGEHERHRLNVFAPQASKEPEGRPVLIFVHGGNFVAGNKDMPGSPFYDNVGAWAAHAGMVGVVVNYRLAPEHRHPSGAEDLAAVVRWAEQDVTGFGGAPHRLVIMGASAGATHVADYVTATSAGDRPVAGSILLSGMYDLPSFPDRSVLDEYYGAQADLAEVSPLPRLVRCPVPMMIAIAEFDPPAQQQQFLRLAQEYLNTNGTLPWLTYIRGHNHFSEVQHVGTDDDSLGARVRAFVAEVTSWEGTPNA